MIQGFSCVMVFVLFKPMLQSSGARDLFSPNHFESRCCDRFRDFHSHKCHIFELDT